MSGQLCECWQLSCRPGFLKQLLDLPGLAAGLTSCTAEASFACTSLTCASILSDACLRHQTGPVNCNLCTAYWHS